MYCLVVRKHFYVFTEIEKRVPSNNMVGTWKRSCFLACKSLSQVNAAMYATIVQYNVNGMIVCTWNIKRNSMAMPIHCVQSLDCLRLHCMSKILHTCTLSWHFLGWVLQPQTSLLTYACMSWRSEFTMALPLSRWGWIGPPWTDMYELWTEHYVICRIWEHW